MGGESSLDLGIIVQVCSKEPWPLTNFQRGIAKRATGFVENVEKFFSLGVELQVIYVPSML